MEEKVNQTEIEYSYVELKKGCFENSLLYNDNSIEVSSNWFEILEEFGEFMQDKYGSSCDQCGEDSYTATFKIEKYKLMSLVSMI